MPGFDVFDQLTLKMMETLRRAREGAADGQIPRWVKPWTTGKLPIFPENYFTRAQYSGINAWLLWLEAEMSLYPSHYWMTFKQKCMLESREESTIRVNKGEHSTLVLRFVDWVPKQFKKLAGNDYLDTQTGEVVSHDRAKHVAMKAYRVFNISQMTGIDLRALQAPDAPPWEQLNEQAEAFLWALQKKWPHAWQEVGERAFHARGSRLVRVPPRETFRSEQEFWGTVFHEWTHFTGSDLGRESDGVFGSPSYAEEELVAELGAMFLSTYFGMENFISHAGYIDHWLRAMGDDTKLVYRAATQARKAADHLLKESGYGCDGLVRKRQKQDTQELPEVRPAAAD